MIHRSILVVAIAGLLCGSAAQARILVVPDEYSTIWDANQAAVPGDTIGVQAGEYEVTNIEIESGVHLIGLVADSSLVSIRVASAGYVCFVFQAGELSTTVEGLELRGTADPTIGSGVLLNYNDHLVIRRCSLVGGFNYSADGTLVFTRADILIEQCHITCVDAGPVEIFKSLRDGDPFTAVMRDCLFTHDYGNVLAPTIRCPTGSHMIFENCTIMWFVGPGYDHYSDYALEFVNCIVSDMGTGVDPEYMPDVLELRYNDFLSTQYGPCPACGYQEGNFTADPLFCDEAAGDYRIQADSPCRGAGEGGADVGARLGYCYPVAAVEPGEGVPARAGIRAWPNPAPGEVRLAFDLPPRASAQLVVLDAVGAKVWEREVHGAVGGRELTWDARSRAGSPLPSGVYFVRLQSDGGATMSRSVLLVR